MEGFDLDVYLQRILAEGAASRADLALFTNDVRDGAGAVIIVEGLEGEIEYLVTQFSAQYAISVLGRILNDIGRMAVDEDYS